MKTLPISLARQNGLISNHKKCEVMLIGTRNTIAISRDLVQIFLDGELLKQTISVKYLKMHIDRNLNWNMHVYHVLLYPRLKLLNRVSKYLSWKMLRTMYKQTIL